MLLGASILLVLLTLTLFVRAALANFSWSRIERLCANQPERLTEIFKTSSDAAAAWRGFFWLQIAALVLLVANAGTVLWDGRFILVWTAFILFELFITRPLVQVAAEPLIVGGWPLLRIVTQAFQPVLWIEKTASALFQRVAGRDEEQHTQIQEEILSVVNEARREGSLRIENAEDMIEGLIELHNVRVSEIMTPRTRMEMLKSTATIEDARATICEHGHSRIPVHGENRDEVVGILYAKDLLPYLDGQSPRAAELRTLTLRQPVYVPESKPVDLLLREFQRSRVHIAIVLDEFGGVSGLVTIEDILEEIVGEIADEHDELEVPPILKLADHRWEVAGPVRIEEVNEALGLDLAEDGDYDTIAGYVFHTLGRLPTPGESIRHGETVITVVEAGKRTVDRVRIETAAPASSPAN